jgi:hypothetical protein
MLDEQRKKARMQGNDRPMSAAAGPRKDIREGAGGSEFRSRSRSPDGRDRARDYDRGKEGYYSRDNRDYKKDYGRDRVEDERDRERRRSRDRSRDRYDSRPRSPHP